MALADRFISSKGEPVIFDGEPVYWTYWIPAVKGDILAIQLIDYAESPVQGLALHADGCALELTSLVAKDVALWADNAPELTEVRIVKAKEGARVGVYNIWRDSKYGSTMARLNNASMRAIAQDDVIELRCSDGIGDPTFSDLVVRIARRPMHLRRGSRD